MLRVENSLCRSLYQETGFCKRTSGYVIQRTATRGKHMCQTTNCQRSSLRAASQFWGGGLPVVCTAVPGTVNLGLVPNTRDRCCCMASRAALSDECLMSSEA